MHALHAEAWIPDVTTERIDREITLLAQKKGELDAEIGRWLLAAQRGQVHRRFGFGSFFEYVERRLGYDPRTTREKIRVARSLEELPKLRGLLETGKRAWSAVREIARVATPDTEEAWVSASEGRTAHQVERLVRGRKPGDRPDEPKDPLITPRRMHFHLEPEAYALVREAFDAMRIEEGRGMTPAEALVAMAQKVLGPAPESKGAYQISLTVCVSCERTWMKSATEMVEVSSANADCARCDCELEGFTRIDEGVVDPEPTLSEDEVEPEVAHVGHAKLEEIAKLDPVLGARGLIRIASKLFGQPLKSVTPRTRRAVKARDHGQCVVPGCRAHAYTQLHHQNPRFNRGPNTYDNLISLCFWHHRAVHEGVLAIEGTPSTGLEFRHADGTSYGQPLWNPPDLGNGSAGMAPVPGG